METGGKSVVTASTSHGMGESWQLRVDSWRFGNPVRTANRQLPTRVAIRKKISNELPSL
jgi:hypothetical protein